MSTVLDREQAVQLVSLNDHLLHNAQEQERLARERRLLFVSERDDWRERGVDAHIVSQRHAAPAISRRHLVDMWETIGDFYGRGEYKRSVHYKPMYRDEEQDDKWGPYASAYGVWIHRGQYVCTLGDDDAAVIVRTNFTPTAAQVGRAVSRLRNFARREHMKISVSDTSATIKSPMNDVVFEGDIETAFLWLCGITNITEQVTEWDRAKENAA